MRFQRISQRDKVLGRDSYEASLRTVDIGDEKERNGNCRLLRTLTARLSETAPTWGKLVAPWAEYVAQTLWATTALPRTRSLMPTRLTQRHRREVKGSPLLPMVEPPTIERLCRGCGKTIRDGRNHCANCAVTGATERLVKAAQVGRIASHSPEALAKEAESQRQHARARSSWNPSSQPAWLTPELYSEKIQPLLAAASSSAIASRIGVSRWYAGRIREGYRPHPRHWLELAKLVEV